MQRICKLKLALVNRSSEALAFMRRLSMLRFLSVMLGAEQIFRSRPIRVERLKLEQLQVANYHEARVRVAVDKLARVKARGGVDVLK